MKGDLVEELDKGGKRITRAMNPDRVYTKADGNGELTLHGRSLLFIRNVGHLMTNDAILDKAGNEVPEGIMDGLFTSLIAIHNPQGQHHPRQQPHRLDVHRQAEDARPGRSRLRHRTVRPRRGRSRPAAQHPKVGIMDEERRTTINLKACIKEARERVVSINTGFLDRTGDEIHTSMEAGPMVRKAAMKSEKWISAYENNNVDVIRPAYSQGKAQIGKGMWAMPDLMAAMLAAEGRPSAGRRQHRVGTVADRSHPARDALPQDRRAGAPGRTGQAREGFDR